jgi:hypothetical protein
MLGFVLASALDVSPAQAQLNTQHVKGTTGLKSGSQPPPHVYVVAPLVCVYRTDDVRNRDGQRLLFGNTTLTSLAYLGGLNVVTMKKILGGTYGLQVLFPVYLNKSRRYHAATIASFDVQSEKEDSETRVGNVMNRRVPRHSHPRAEQGLRPRSGSLAGAGERRHPLRIHQGELSARGLCADDDKRKRADPAGDVSHEAAEAALTVS